MTIRSNLVTLNAENDYADRGVLRRVLYSKTKAHRCWNLLTLEENTDLHIYRDSGVYKVVSFDKCSERQITVHQGTVKHHGDFVSSKAVAIHERDQLLLRAVSLDLVRIVNREFMDMYRAMQTMGGRYVTCRATSGKEVVRFSSEKQANLFRAAYPDVEVIISKKTTVTPSTSKVTSAKKATKVVVAGKSPTPAVKAVVKAAAKGKVKAKAKKVK